MTASAFVEQALFMVLALIALGGAAGVVSARSVFGSALFLVLALFGVAGLYMALDAGFVAVVQILVYVGAISVLILFGVMLTPQVMNEPHLANGQWALGGIVALSLFGALAVLAYGTDWPLAADAVIPPGGAVVVTEDAGGPAGMTVAAARSIPGAVEERDRDGNTVVRVPGAVERLGRAFLIDHLLAFEVISVILLVALVGAIAVARE